MRKFFIYSYGKVSEMLSRKNVYASMSSMSIICVKKYIYIFFLYTHTHFFDAKYLWKTIQNLETPK